MVAPSTAEGSGTERAEGPPLTATPMSITDLRDTYVLTKARKLEKTMQETRTKTKRRREEGDTEEPMYREDHLWVVIFFEVVVVGAGGVGAAWSAARGATTMDGEETSTSSFPT